jgi:hypothetical protein
VARNNLDIFVDDDFKSHRIEATAKFTALDEGKYFFPPPAYGFDISFDIYIPERLQFELFPVMSSAIHAEKFRVYIRGAYHFPVTFVELIDAKNVSEPSMAVAVIREFLRQQFHEKKPEYIQFDCLGPSPFHADFLLRKGNNKTGAYDSNGFSINGNTGPAYNLFEIQYSIQRFSSLQEAKEKIFEVLLEEASVFYRIVHYKGLQIIGWGNLQNKVYELVEANKLHGLKAAWFQAFRSSQQVQNVVFSLSDFEGNRILESFEIKIIYQGLKRDTKEIHLQGFFEEELDEFPDYPVNQVKDIIELLESRRSKRIDNIVVLTASVIGGIIGAVITMLVVP